MSLRNVRVALDTTYEVDFARWFLTKLGEIDSVSCGDDPPCIPQFENLRWKLDDSFSQSDMQSDILEKGD